MKHSVLLPFSFICILFITSCKKESIETRPVAEKAQLTIGLAKNYMPEAKIDSAFATWTVTGHQQKVRLDIRHDSLIADLKLFNPGTGTLVIQIFSKMKFDQFNCQWVCEKELTITGNKTLAYEGPAGFEDNAWSPRAMLKDGIGHYALVALRPDDPYFYVQNVTANVRKLVVARYYWNISGGVSVIGGKEWECQTGCTDANSNVENKQFFKSLPQQIGSRIWNHIEIDILFIDNEWGGGYVLMLNHTLNG
jgi:hypothetical protein